MPVNTQYFDVRLYSGRDLCRMVGTRAKELRLERSLRQSDLAEAVGVTLATIRRFEQTGKVGFYVVVRVAIALGAEAEFARLFSIPEARSIAEIIRQRKPRRRAPRSQ
jgi:transcriptional regulator with XRE-family HTH domain